MKKLLIVSGLVMSMTMNAMDDGKRAEGAAMPLKHSPEVAQMPVNPRRGPKQKASPTMRAAVQAYFNEDLKGVHEQFKAKELAKQKARDEQNNQ